jgi:hypothetical protein
VAESPDRTHDILLRVAEFLKKLPEEQYEALASGEARLEVIPKGARVTGGAAKKPSAPVSLPVAVETVAKDLAAIGDRDAATTYLNDIKLARPQLVLLAETFGLTVPSKMNMAKIVAMIVDLKVGHRLVTDAILGHR